MLVKLHYQKGYYSVKILSIYYHSKGFLIIELLIAVGLLAIFGLSVLKYQSQINLYKKATEQLYTAISLCENTVEELWSSELKPNSNYKNINNFIITTVCTPGPLNAYYNIEISASWVNIFQQKQKISLDAICVG